MLQGSGNPIIDRVRKSIGERERLRQEERVRQQTRDQELRRRDPLESLLFEEVIAFH